MKDEKAFLILYLHSVTFSSQLSPRHFSKPIYHNQKQNENLFQDSLYWSSFGACPCHIRQHIRGFHHDIDGQKSCHWVDHADRWTLAVFDRIAGEEKGPIQRRTRQRQGQQSHWHRQGPILNGYRRCYQHLVLLGPC